METSQICTQHSDFCLHPIAGGGGFTEVGNRDLVNFGYDATTKSRHFALKAEDAEVAFQKVDLIPITEMSRDE